MYIVCRGKSRLLHRNKFLSIYCRFTVSHYLFVGEVLLFVSEVFLVLISFMSSRFNLMLWCRLRFTRQKHIRFFFPVSFVWVNVIMYFISIVNLIFVISIVCNMPHKMLPICHKKVARWYYDKASKTCNMYDGRCDVKGNMFQTHDAFEDICFENGNYADSDCPFGIFKLLFNNNISSCNW